MQVYACTISLYCYICAYVHVHFILYSDEPQEQINYALLTSEIYTFCDVPSPGFCEQVRTTYVYMLV